MNILIACEESQRICIEMRKRGHNAFSCDIQKCSGGYPQWHIISDALILLTDNVEFITEDKKKHVINKWDMLIAHPPCTYLSNVSAVHMFSKKKLNKERYKKALAAKEFFINFLNAPIDKICVENPMPLSILNMPKPDCIIQPYEFGDHYSKRTYLWLKGLPPLIPTEYYIGEVTPWVNASGGKQRKGKKGVANTKKERSKTFCGIAKAMATQWT